MVSVRPSKIRTEFLKQSNTRNKSILLAFAKLFPPLPELIRVFDFPYCSSITSRLYPVKNNLRLLAFSSEAAGRMYKVFQIFLFA